MDGDTKLRDRGLAKYGAIEERQRYVPTTNKVTSCEVLHKGLGSRETDQRCRHEGAPQTRFWRTVFDVP